MLQFMIVTTSLKGDTRQVTVEIEPRKKLRDVLKKAAEEHGVHFGWCTLELSGTRIEKSTWHSYRDGSVTKDGRIVHQEQREKSARTDLRYLLNLTAL